MKNKYKYLSVDSKGHLRVIMPIVSGDTIGLDNTCKASKELKSFFYGKKKIKVEKNGVEIEKEIDDNIFT